MDGWTEKQSDRVKKTDKLTDRQTDSQTDGKGKKKARKRLNGTNDSYVASLYTGSISPTQSIRFSYMAKIVIYFFQPLFFSRGFPGLNRLTCPFVSILEYRGKKRWLETAEKETESESLEKLIILQVLMFLEPHPS